MTLNSSSGRGQSGLELIVVFGFLLLFFIVVTLFTAEKNTESGEIKMYLDAKKIADTLVDNINTISEQGSGYYRQFSLPEKLYGGYEYNITSYENIVEISWGNKIMSYQTATSKIRIMHLEKGADRLNCIVNKGGRIQIREKCDTVSVLVYNRSVSRDYSVLENITSGCDIELDLTNDVHDLENQSRIQNYDILWMSYDSISTTSGYTLTPAAEESIKNYASDGGVVWMSSSDSAGWDDGWLPYEVGLEFSPDKDSNTTAYAQELFKKPYNLNPDTIVLDGHFTNWNSKCAVLSYEENDTSKAQFLKIDRGLGYYLLSVVDSSNQSNDAVNRLTFINALRYMDSTFTCR